MKIRQFSCVNARGILPAAHNHPHPVRGGRLGRGKEGTPVQARGGVGGRKVEGGYHCPGWGRGVRVR